MKFNTFVTRENVAINSIHIDTHRVDLTSNIVSERINSLQCYELTRRYSQVLLSIDFTIDLCCASLVCTSWMWNEAELVTIF